MATKPLIEQGHPAGFRNHKCERCGQIYLCEDCTNAMAQGHYHERRGNIYQHPTQALYSRRHTPDAITVLWLCEKCR